MSGQWRAVDTTQSIDSGGQVAAEADVEVAPVPVTATYGNTDSVVTFV
jgi:hypothetical protein